jgi:hypothetical protein
MGITIAISKKEKNGFCAMMRMCGAERRMRPFRITQRAMVAVQAMAMFSFTPKKIFIV